MCIPIFYYIQTKGLLIILIHALNRLELQWLIDPSVFRFVILMYLFYLFFTYSSLPGEHQEVEGNPG